VKAAEQAANQKGDLDMRNKLSTQIAKRTALMVVAGMFLVATALLAETADWQKHLDWSIGNHTSDPGETNCIDQYVATEPACIVGGGRSCLMKRAIESAKANNYAYAFRLSLITQCHNGTAQSQIGAAGQQAVGDYLKTK
jgi:hypothetical protein